MLTEPPKSELEREANIAKNRALFENLGLKQAIKDLGSSSSKTTAKPVQPKRVKRERSEVELPRRQSRRLLTKMGDFSKETKEERKLREVRVSGHVSKNPNDISAESTGRGTGATRGGT